MPVGKSKQKSIFQEETMKKFCVALLAAAMVAGSALCASAMDVKFSGSYYVQGNYANNWAVGDKDTYGSAADYGQRLRVQTDFKVAEGLTLTTRFDALEGVWGQSFTGSNGYGAVSYNRNTGTNVDENNISFDRAYVTFAVPFGKFIVGRAASSNWGTIFGNNDYDSDQIRYIGNFGPVEVGATIEKLAESYNTTLNSNPTDKDGDNYHLYGIYKWGKGQAGLKAMYGRNATDVAYGTLAALPYIDTTLIMQPFAQATFGPVFVEAEINWVAWGKRDADAPGVLDRDYDNGFNAYLHAKMDMGPAYFGGVYAYVSGQDPAETAANGGDITAGPGGGRIWNPTLILWNEYSNRWLGGLGGANGTATETTDSMSNAHLFHIYAGVKPMAKLDVKASVSYAMADQLAAGQDDKLGTEIDLTAAYKIYDNLTYTIGGGYLFAGDFFKGTAATNGPTDDTYLLMHRLDLTF